MAFSYSGSATVLLVLFFGLFTKAPASTAAADDHLQHAFEKWMSDSGRVYQSDSEKQNRFQVFKTNFEYIESVKNKPGLTYTLSLNKFADLTND